jgi:hypothetical protein
MHPTAEERRQHKRFHVENSVSVSPHGVFQVMDISKGGFCFKCPPYTPISDLWETDIVTSVATLEGFPVNRVWVSMAENSTHAYLPMSVGVKFGRLTQKQDTELSQIIEAISEADGTEH